VTQATNRNSAPKNAADAKRGNPRNWKKARENMQLVSSAGKHATGAKRGKTRNGWQVRKISVSWVTISGSFATDWLETNEQKLGFL